jgi:hypothetical protein
MGESQYHTNPFEDISSRYESQEGCQEKVACVWSRREEIRQVQLQE